MPPDPWPFAETFTAAQVGPPGTEWHFTWGDLAARYTYGLSHAGQSLVTAWLRRAKIAEGLFDTTSIVWTNQQGSEGVMKLWRASVHTNISGVEEAINVLHLKQIPGGTAPVALTPDGATTVGNMVADAWRDFMTANANGMSGTGLINSCFPDSAAVDEVRVAAIEWTAAPPAKLTYDVPTQFVPVTPTIPGAGGYTLPLECAMVVSLGTGARGPRNRGRTYLGPIGAQTMDNTAVGGLVGLYKGLAVASVAQAFMQQIVLNLANDPVSPLQLVVASMKYGTSRDVTETRCGQVPDSQRRRRRSQIENYAQG